MSNLLQCSECDRHLRISETSCPFCGSAITAAARGAAEDAAAASRGLAGASRAKRYAVRAALLAGAATLAGCGSGNKATNNGGGTSGAGNGDNVLVQTTATANPDGKHNPDDRADPRERRRHDPNLPPMPYGCVWPDEEVAV